MARPLRRFLVAFALIVAGAATGMGAAQAAPHATTHTNHTHATTTNGIADWWW